MGTKAADPDDSADWLEAATREPVLVAAELYYLRRPAARVDWRSLLEEVKPPSLPAPDWIGKRRRVQRVAKRVYYTSVEEKDHAAAAAAAAKEGRSSPTTPLSWFNFFPAAVAESDPPREPVKVSTAPKGKLPPPPPPPLVASKRPGKRKMAVDELKECERIELQMRMELRKEIEEQMLKWKRLMEEHTELKKGLDLLKCSSAADRPKLHVLPFDLNEALAEAPDAGPL